MHIGMIYLPPGSSEANQNRHIEIIVLKIKQVAHRNQKTTRP
jgi:hypothetical protein